MTYKKLDGTLVIQMGDICSEENIPWLEVQVNISCMVDCLQELAHLVNDQQPRKERGPLVFLSSKSFLEAAVQCLKDMAIDGHRVRSNLIERLLEVAIAVLDLGEEAGVSSCPGNWLQNQRTGAHVPVARVLVKKRKCKRNSECTSRTAQPLGTVAHT
jgi:hypothetical protein